MVNNNGIRFPKMHIAESVVNRILNLRDELPPVHRPMPTPTPNVPDPNVQGLQLDQALAQPTPPVDGGAGPESLGNNTVEAVLSGGTPLNGLLDTVSGQ